MTKSNKHELKGTIIIMDSSSALDTLSSSERFAHLISEIFNPLFLLLPTLFIISVTSTPHIGIGVIWWLIAVIGTSVLPYLFIRRGVKLGRYTDHHVSKREQRFIPLTFGAICMIGTCAILWLLQVSTALMATIVSIIVALLVAIAITQRWKISLHMIGATGAITIFTLLFGWVYLWLSPFIIIVGWARWKVRAHTVGQAVAGMLLAMNITLLFFSLFGLI